MRGAQFGFSAVIIKVDGTAATQDSGTAERAGPLLMRTYPPPNWPDPYITMFLAVVPQPRSESKSYAAQSKHAKPGYRPMPAIHFIHLKNQALLRYLSVTDTFECLYVPAVMMPIVKRATLNEYKQAII